MKLVLFALGIVLVISCSMNHTPENSSSPPQKIYFFKATGGEHMKALPLAGVRFYDNDTFVHVFHRDCDASDASPVKDTYTSSPGKPIAESSRLGAIAQSKPLCGYDAEFHWEKDRLVTKDGNLGFGPTHWKGDVEYTAISKEEFFRELKAQTIDRGFNYRGLPLIERDGFDRACKDLAEKNCSDLF